MNIVQLRDFYATALGRRVETSIANLTNQLWSVEDNQSVVVFGYGAGAFDDMHAVAERSMILMPSAQGVLHDEGARGNRSCLVDDEHLPLADQSVDKCILMHSLEFSANPKALLREVWRILKDNGRLIVIVPNRQGVWTRAEDTPFGHGNPFSKKQLAKLVQDSLFVPSVIRTGLAFWPFQSQFGQILAHWLSRVHVEWLKWWGGALVLEAGKQLYATGPVGELKAPGKLFVARPSPF